MYTQKAIEDNENFFHSLKGIVEGTETEAFVDEFNPYSDSCSA